MSYYDIVKDPYYSSVVARLLCDEEINHQIQRGEDLSNIILGMTADKAITLFHEKKDIEKITYLAAVLWNKKYPPPEDNYSECYHPRKRRKIG